MRTIAFMSQKGGSGKSTLAVHVAVAAMESGENAALFDTDPQQSVTKWGETREQEQPIVATVSSYELADALALAKTEGVTYAFVDTAPHHSPDAAKVATMADYIVIPCRPSAFDIGTASKSSRIVKAAKKKGAFILSACPFRAPETKEARELLADYNLAVCPHEVTERRSFARALSSGRAVTEFEGSGKASDEIRLLWTWIKKAAK